MVNLTNKTYRFYELYNRINNDKDCLFVAFIGNNLNYVGVNAFIHKLHEEDGIEHISGVLINLKNDPTVGHTFANDSFRFPHYADVEIAFIGGDDFSCIEKKSSKFYRFLKNRLSLRRRQNLYVLTDAPNVLMHISIMYLTDRKVCHVITADGVCFSTKSVRIRYYVNDCLKIFIEKVLAGNVVLFRPFRILPYIKRDTKLEKFYREAAEDEHLVLPEIDYNKKYVLFVSQAGVFKDYNSIIQRVLDTEKDKGYEVYIKPHSHESIYTFPQMEYYHVLPRSYAIESIIGGAPRRPDKIISVVSTSLFTCSAWFGVPCYSILGVVPYDNMSEGCKYFLKEQKSGEFPNLHLYEE